MSKQVLNYIQYSGIEKSFGKRKQLKRVIKDIDISLCGGDCTLLTGKNGSGKSTLLRILAGQLKPDSATINTGLQTFNWKQAHKILRKQVMYLHQEPYMFDGSVRCNLAYAVKGSNSANKIKQVLKWADLESHMNTEAKCLSGGEKQRVALAQAWLKQPSVLLLDEPTANMDDYSKHFTEELLSRFKDNGTALLIASHDPYHFHQIMDMHLSLIEGELHEAPADSFSEYPENVSIFPNKKQITYK